MSKRFTHVVEYHIYPYYPDKRMIKLERIPETSLPKARAMAEAIERNEMLVPGTHVLVRKLEKVM